MAGSELSASLMRIQKFPVRGQSNARECDVMQFGGSALHVFCLTAVAVLCISAADADEKPMMRAVVAHEYGPPDVLKLEQVPAARAER